MDELIRLRKVFLELDVGWDYPYFHSLRNGGWIFGATAQTLDDFKIFLNGHEIEILTKTKGRPDVAAAFPDFNVSPTTGFDFYLNPLFLKSQENCLEIRVYKEGGVIFSRSKEFIFKRKMMGAIEYPQEQSFMSSKLPYISGWVCSYYPLVCWEAQLNGAALGPLSLEAGIFRPDLVAFYRESAFEGKWGFKFPFYPWSQKTQNQVLLTVKNSQGEELILKRNYQSSGLKIIPKLYNLLT